MSVTDGKRTRPQDHTPRLSRGKSLDHPPVLYVTSLSMTTSSNLYFVRVNVKHGFTENVQV